jgi:SAM-dependent methyltransferase
VDTLTGVASLEKTGYSGLRPDIVALVPPSARNILDVGCARGELGMMLKARSRDIHITGIEMSPVLALQAQARLDHVIVETVENALRRLSDESFDCIIFADVLEHLVNPYAVLASLKVKLHENGSIVASIPNVRHHRVLRWLVLHGRWEYGEGGLLDSGHLRFFTLSGIRRMFTWAGYETEVAAVNRVGLRRKWKGHRYMGNAITQFVDYQYLVIARPVPGPIEQSVPWWSQTRTI